jgi:hypothetical protein
MKRAMKSYLKTITRYGFKWDTMTPLDMYKRCEGDGDITISKKDLKKLIVATAKNHYILTQIARNRQV